MHIWRPLLPMADIPLLPWHPSLSVPHRYVTSLITEPTEEYDEATQSPSPAVARPFAITVNWHSHQQLPGLPWAPPQAKQMPYVLCCTGAIIHLTLQWWHYLLCLKTLCHGLMFHLPDFSRRKGMTACSVVNSKSHQLCCYHRVVIHFSDSTYWGQSDEWMAGYNSLMEMVAGRQQILCKIDEQNTIFRVLIKKKPHTHWSWNKTWR